VGKTKTGEIDKMDLKIIGIGIAITFALIALSAVTLYLTFRIKETFREDKGTKVQIAKIGFIIGILFLASGLFYFFAQAMYQPDKPLNENDVILSNKSEIFELNNLTTLDLSYPDTVKTDEMYILTFSINNPSSRTVRNATIKLSGLDPFEVKSNFDVDFNVLDLGDAQPGKRGGYIQMKAPSNPTTLEGELIFESKDTSPLTRNIKIKVNGNVIPSFLNPIASAVLPPKPTPTPDTWGRYYSPTVFTPISSDTSSSGDTTNTTPTVTATPAPTDTATPGPTETATPAPTDTATPAPTDTATPGPTDTATPAPTDTATPAPTDTATPAPTDTATPAPTDTATPAPTDTATPAPTETPTPAPTSP
jgi:hypothetical protein